MKNNNELITFNEMLELRERDNLDPEVNNIASITMSRGIGGSIPLDGDGPSSWSNEMVMTLDDKDLKLIYNRHKQKINYALSRNLNKDLASMSLEIKSLKDELNRYESDLQYEHHCNINKLRSKLNSELDKK
jgi:hypothetical protein